jgi:hypothetical protein
MAFDYQLALEFLLNVPREVPVIKGWNRLEGRPRAVNFERALRAEVRDALWFLTRQWQFGEFQGEDAASPVEVRTVVQSSVLTSYSPAGGPAIVYPADVPLETRVEREPVPADLTLHIQVTRYFFKLVAAQPRLGIIRDLYLDPAAYGLAAGGVRGYIDTEAEQVLSIALGQLLDGAKLLSDIASGAHATNVAAFPGLTPAEIADLTAAGEDLFEWFRRAYQFPDDAADDAWVPRFLEYQFACEARGPESAPAVLVSDQYANGRLDWFAFDVGTSPPEAGTTAGEAPVPAPPDHALSFIPAPVAFSGMPNPRYWEFESRRTEFADIDANTTDVAKLLMVEFALIYSNDWCVIPYVVDVGSLNSLPGLLVTDDFGETTLVRAAGRGRDDSWQRWSMFTLGNKIRGGPADFRLFVPPTLPKSMEGEAIEQVVFLRDEMANMVWAVEKIVPSATGNGADGYVVGRAAATPTPSLPLHPTAAQARYILGTDVPPNWHPFIPVHVPGSNRKVQLQRARMPEQRDIFGRVLRVPSPYYVNEEEAPRAGKTVSRSYQRARWVDGRTLVWIGRRVTTGRGEGNSGLAFDQVEDLKLEEPS